MQAVRDGAVLDRPLRVAVVGGGPSGACAAETLAKAGIETYLIERKMDNCKVQLLALAQQASACALRTANLWCLTLLALCVCRLRLPLPATGA